MTLRAPRAVSRSAQPAYVLHVSHVYRNKRVSRRYAQIILTKLIRAMAAQRNGRINHLLPAQFVSRGGLHNTFIA